MNFDPLISLSNVVNKIGSKMLANIIKPFRDEIISPTQSIFVPNRLITDNVLWILKWIIFLKCRTQGRKQYMSLELDGSKAYDMVEWVFLKHVPMRMSFADYFLLNGKQFGALQPARGHSLELSPYLFICCCWSLHRNGGVGHGTRKITWRACGSIDSRDLTLLFWRAFHDILLTRVALMRHHIGTNPYCEFCRMAIKTEGHIFF